MEKRQHGIALVLVLWVLTLLTVMAVGLTAAQRTETALSENHVSAARFRAAADAAIVYTVLIFGMPPPDAAEPDVSTWLPNGTPYPWRFGGLDLSIRIFNEASRIDLNEASPELLSALMSLLGADDDTAVSVASAIVDWRDDNDLKLLNGAEDRDYIDAGRPIGAKDMPFITVEELLQVLGMTSELYRAVAQEVSVDLNGAGFDERFATPIALAAVQGIPLEDAEARVTERDLPLFEDGGGPGFVDRGGPLYRIQVSESGAGGRGGRRMEALVETIPGQQPPYQIRWRRFGLSSIDLFPVNPDAG
jgi:general secretion pathway protein K